MPLVYRELRRRAAAYLRRERSGHTLQPTALVHDAYLRLVDQNRLVWQNRSQFFGVASQMMAGFGRPRPKAPDGEASGQWVKVTLEDAARKCRPPMSTCSIWIGRRPPRVVRRTKSRIVKLRYFGGLSLEEAADVVGISVATVERDWQAARAWLFKTLSALPLDIGREA